jgi:hypothetical protein
MTVVGVLIVGGVLAWALAGRREEFTAALNSAPLWVLLTAAALQLLALVSRSEAWHASVTAAEGTVSRRRLHRAASLGNLASILNTHLAAAGVVITGLGRLAGCRRRECWRGLAVLRSMRGRNRVVLLVLVAVFAQILRNWMMLQAVGVDASVLDATAVLIAMVTLTSLPIGPSVGAAAVVLILGANGVALTAAAGVLLTVTGIVGALCFAAWAAVDGLLPALVAPEPAPTASQPGY